MGTANFYKRNSKRFMEGTSISAVLSLKANADHWSAFYVSLNNELFSYYVYDHFREYFAVNSKLTSCSPVVRRTPFGRRTSLLATSTPAAVTASAMSRVPMEPNSFTFVASFRRDGNSFQCIDFLSASISCCQNFSQFSFQFSATCFEEFNVFLVAGTALPCGTRKLRA